MELSDTTFNEYVENYLIYLAVEKKFIKKNNKRLSF